MKFRAAHIIHDVSLADYEQLYFDEAFSIALCKTVQLRRQLISRQLDGSRLQRVVCVGPQREIPAPVAKVLGAERIEYTEHIDYSFGSFAGRWHTVSSVMPDKVQSFGSFSFAAQGAHVLRVVEGEINVKVFGLGKIIERFIVADVEKSYAQAAAYTNTYLAAQHDSGSTGQTAVLADKP